MSSSRLVVRRPAPQSVAVTVVGVLLGLVLGFLGGLLTVADDPDDASRVR